MSKRFEKKRQEDFGEENTCLDSPTFVHFTCTICVSTITILSRFRNVRRSSSREQEQRDVVEHVTPDHERESGGDVLDSKRNEEGKIAR